MTDASALNPHGGPFEPYPPARPTAIELTDATLAALGRRALITVGVLGAIYHFLIAPPLGLPRVDFADLMGLAALTGIGVVGRTAQSFAPNVPAAR